jgi:hypothetical protein
MIPVLFCGVFTAKHRKKIISKKKLPQKLAPQRNLPFFDHISPWKHRICLSTALSGLDFLYRSWANALVLELGLQLLIC